MTAEGWQRLKSLFGQALDLETGARTQFVEDACGSNAELGDCLRSMVDHHQAASTLLNGPAISRERLVEYLVNNMRTFELDEVLCRRFQVERFIGEGGMGEVYAAKDLELGGKVALKTLRPALYNDSLLALFKQEILMARKVTHENVARMHDLFFHEPREEKEQRAIAFLSMELLEGETLAERIDRLGPMRESEALPIAKQIAEGLARAHAVGVIHRDFKSGNIMLVEEPGGPVRAAITDFGLARLQSASNVSVSEGSDSGVCLEGTPAYIAPEQLTASTISPAVDVYAMGVVLFEMVTGKLPFAGGSAREVAERRLTEDAPSPRIFVPHLDTRWDSAIQACLRRQPESRPQSPLDVIALIRSRKRLVRRLAIGVFVSSLLSVATWEILQPRPLNPEAVQSFERGEDFAKRRNAEGLLNAANEFQSAISLEPRYTKAWVGLAEAYSAMENFGIMRHNDAMTKAIGAAERAVALEPHSGLALGVLGYLRSLDVHKWLTAEELLRRATYETPSDPTVRLWYGAYLGKKGSSKEAFDQLRAGLQLDPASFILNQQLATQLFRARQFPEFYKQARELVRLQPYEVNSYVTLARALTWAKDYDAALKACDNVEKYGDSELAFCLRGSVEAARGNRDRALGIAEEVRSYWAAKPFETHVLAVLYAQAGEVEEAGKLLQAGFERGDSSVLGAPTNPSLDILRGNREYLKFLKLIGWPKVSGRF